MLPRHFPGLLWSLEGRHLTPGSSRVPRTGPALLMAHPSVGGWRVLLKSKPIDSAGSQQSPHSEWAVLVVWTGTNFQGLECF